MAKTSFSEEIYLRALTGMMVGEMILSEYNKVAVIAPKNIICSAISAAAEASFVSATGGRAAHFVVEESNVEEVISQVEKFDPEAVLLMFGGETPIEDTKRLFIATLREMANRKIEAEIIFHVRIFAASGVQGALEDDKIRGYLESSVLYVYTVDLERGFLIYNALEVEGKEIEMIRLEEYPVSAEHADLLNRSLRDRTISWKEI